MEGAEFENRLLYFNLDAIYFLVVLVDGESAYKDQLTTFGYGREHALTKSVPGIHVDPESRFFVVAVLGYSEAELDHLVTGVAKGNCLGCLTDTTDDC